MNEETRKEIKEALRTKIPLSLFFDMYESLLKGELPDIFEEIQSESEEILKLWKRRLKNND